MKRIPNPAEDVTRIPPASRKNMAFAESVSTCGNTPDRGGEESEQIHSFSRKLAREIQKKKGAHAGHAAHETVVLKYLANRVRASKNIVDGKQWFYTTLKYLHTKYPYIGKTALGDIVHRLAEYGYCEIGNFNKHKYDFTFWYHVPQDIRDAGEEDLIYFSRDLAAEVGVPGALLHRNFTYWLADREERKLPKVVHMSPAFLAEHLPLSVDTIKRGLKTLDGNYLKKVSDTIPLYEKREEYIGANPVRVGADPVRLSANPVGLSADPVNDTYYKSVGNVLEKNSKEDAALPSSELPSDGKNNIGSSDNSSHPGIMPDAGGQGGAEMCHGKERLTTTVFSASSNDDMPGSAADVNIEWPQVEGYEQLRTINRSNNHIAIQIEKDRRTKEQFLDTVDDICRNVMGYLDLETTDKLYNEYSEDEVVATVVPFLRDYLGRTEIDPYGGLFDLYYYGSIECIVGAFLFPENNSGWYFHGISLLNSVTYDIHLLVWSYFNEIHERAVEKEFSQRKREFASVDEHKEHDTALAPAEKARIFRNGINARNKVGWIFYDQKHHTDCINIESMGLNLIKKLFVLNPELSVADLLEVMDACLNVYVNQPSPQETIEYGVKWHARHGAQDVWRFAMCLKAIVRDVGYNKSITFLGDAKEKQEEAETLAA